MAAFASHVLDWRVPSGLGVVIPVLPPPEISADHAISSTTSCDLPMLTEPSITSVSTLDGSGANVEVRDVALQLAEAQIEIVDLFVPLGRPRADGSIYIKDDEQRAQLDLFDRRVTVRPSRQTVASDPKSQQGLNVFELLLPLLMPPVGYVQREDLLLPAGLYDFQCLGVKWLYETPNALLADDMGLGKTIQAITAFRLLVRRGQAVQSLVVCPKSVLSNWLRELSRWAPELVAVRVYGPAQNREVSWRSLIGKCHVLVTTYDTLRQDIHFLKGSFDLVIADEVQRIKNPVTVTAKAISQLRCERRWGLTGTPLENDLNDLAGVFNFVKPGLFKPSELPSLTPARARERIKPHLLRRRKVDALKDLPEKVIDTKWLELSEGQRRAYDRAEREGVIGLRDRADVTITHVLALIQKLKQICNFDPMGGESCKVEFLKEYLEEACTDGQKAIIISQYVETLRRIVGQIPECDPLLFTGDLSINQRTEVERRFERDERHAVLLLSLRAGGVGLNLTRANYVLHFDRWWNPAVERQAEDRTHRIGQTRTVFVTRLICQETIEERIERLLERKNLLFREVVDELADVNLEKILSEEELFNLFGLESPRRAKVSTPRAENTNVAPAPGSEGGRAIVVRPEEPFSNLLKLREVLRLSERYLWWADVHFRARGLVEIAVSIDPAKVREIRILSGPANLDDQARSDFRRFAEEMQRKGIQAEWRMLKSFAHDRYIISEKSCYNVPPIGSILQGSYGEMIQTPNRPPFEDWWSQAVPIADFRIVKQDERKGIS